MSDDFMDEQPRFKKGKAKAVALKPWQSFNGTAIEVTKFKCWDGFHGCEQYKSKESYKWAPRVCDTCTTGFAAKYGVKYSEIDALLSVLEMVSRLYGSLTYLKAKPDKIEALRRSQEMHVSRLMQSLIKDWGKSSKVTATTVSYRDWFYAQADLENTKPIHAQGFVSVAQALPVGDRV